MELFDILMFSDIFRGYGKGARGTNGLRESSIKQNEKSVVVISDQESLRMRKISIVTQRKVGKLPLILYSNNLSKSQLILLHFYKDY